MVIELLDRSAASSIWLAIVPSCCIQRLQSIRHLDGRYSRVGHYYTHFQVDSCLSLFRLKKRRGSWNKYLHSADIEAEVRYRRFSSTRFFSILSVLYRDCATMLISLVYVSVYHASRKLKKNNFSSLFLSASTVCCHVSLFRIWIEVEVIRHDHYNYRGLSRLWFRLINTN